MSVAFYSNKELQYLIVINKYMKSVTLSGIIFIYQKGDFIFMDMKKRKKDENHTKSVAKKSQIQGSLFRTIEREKDPSLASS